MPYPIDEPKLQHVRNLMKRDDLDALVVRAPDNIVYLTNYWCMKGYDVAIFPREGEATLITLEPQEEPAGPRGPTTFDCSRAMMPTIHGLPCCARWMLPCTFSTSAG